MKLFRNTNIKIRTYIIDTKGILKGYICPHCNLPFSVDEESAPERVTCICGYSFIFDSDYADYITTEKINSRSNYVQK